MAGEEVGQLYAGARSSKVERAPKELKACTKVPLEPGETRTVRLAVSAADFAYYDAAKGWIVEPGEYEVIVGRHSLDDKALRAEFAIACVRHHEGRWCDQHLRPSNGVEL